MPEEKTSESTAPEPLPPLPELRVEQERLPTTRSPVSADIRRQLEVGIETLEAARDRYTFLEKLLRRKQWQQEVLARGETLRALIRREPEVDEALARLHHRARVEGWPETEPALVLAREVETLRPRLEALTHKRLIMPATQEGRLAERLAHLDRVLLQTLAPPVTPEETVLHQGAFQHPSRSPPLLLMLVAANAVAVLQDDLPLAELSLLTMGCTLAPPFLTVLREALLRRRSGRYWLTAKRLVWQPQGGEPFHIPLHAIRPEGVHLLSDRSVGVWLVDGRFIRLDSIEGAKQLVTLLEQHRPSA